MFKVGDLVDVKRRSDLDYYGKITAINGNEATVKLKFVRHPEGRGRGVCEECGFPGGFSVNGGTGEIVCMRTGCGHEYGFIKRAEIIALDKLINISEKMVQEKKEKIVLRISSKLRCAKNNLNKALKDGIISEEEKKDILKTILAL